MNRATTATSAQTIELFDRYVIPNYKRFPVCLVRGEGSYVWDAEGNRYLDLFPGWGCNILGYSPPPVVRAIQAQIADLIHVPNTWYTEAQGEFAELLCTRGFGQAFFCNSGAEAVEAAIKLARLYGEGRYKIITFENSFHGRTLGALTATAQPKYHEGLGPLVAGFRYAPLNDLDEVKDLIDDETCGILLEPVQGEGGINVAENDFLVGLRQLADQHHCLLIFDEVQTGMGRTGSWFGYQQTPVQPDIMTLAKGLAGGVACGAMIARSEVAKSLRPGTHASTFGGNPLAMAAGIAAVRMIEEEGLLDNCRRMSERFRTRFEALQSELPLIRELRIRGMMIGIELNVPAAAAVQKAMQRGVLLNVTHDTVVRLLPAININEEQVDIGCEVVAEVLREIADES
ncbi:MAG TPA: aspartate aminotransferase family protein [Planctomycetaceae bacterium]|jgi:acetylornithine/N-succinyldiaminopimelate aminotransferase|nr:aspartate aminotransferase family protein [Planctomycetaceae bacterium]